MTGSRDDPVLTISAVSVRYGGVRAVREINMVVPGKSVVGVIGPNGAGKTTLLDAISGFVEYSGQIKLDGRSINGLPAHTRARLRLARTFQTLELFDDLSVYDNIRVFLTRGDIRWLTRSRSRRRRDGEELEKVLNVFGLTTIRSVMTSELSQAERKMVALARAFAMNPRLALLDEPAAGLDPSESLHLGRRLRSLATEETAILVIDHDVGLMLQICDVIYVMDFGEVIAHGAPEQIRRNPRVVAAYLGAEASSSDEPAAVTQ